MVDFTRKPLMLERVKKKEKKLVAALTQRRTRCRLPPAPRTLCHCQIDSIAAGVVMASDYWVSCHTPRHSQTLLPGRLRASDPAAPVTCRLATTRGPRLHAGEAERESWCCWVTSGKKNVSICSVERAEQSVFSPWGRVSTHGERSQQSDDIYTDRRPKQTHDGFHDMFQYW